MGASNATLSNLPLVVPRILALVVVAAIGVWLLVGAGGPSTTRGEEHPAVGTMVPEVRWEPLVGSANSTSPHNWQGKVVLVSYWTTSCPRCVEAFPAILRLHRSFGSDSSFRLVSVLCEADQRFVGQLKTEAEKHLSRFKAELTVHSEDDRDQGRFMQAIGASAFPTTVLVDRAGIIRAVWEGASPAFADEADRLIDELLH